MDKSNAPTLAQMDYCLKVFHLEPKPLLQAAEDFCNVMADWATKHNIGQRQLNEFADQYSILRHAIAAEKESAK